MRYEDGVEVRLGDLVEVDDGAICLVVGVADEERYAAGFERARFQSSPGCALVRREDGGLKWRPYAGSTLVIRARSASSRNESMDVSDLLSELTHGPIPPPLDHYFSLERVEVGDIVKTSVDAIGRIVAVIARHQYDASIDKVDWEYLGHGFLCESQGSGSLTWYEEADEDIELLRRDK